jgi:hypothetical protein
MDHLQRFDLKQFDYVNFINFFTAMGVPFDVYETYGSRPNAKVIVVKQAVFHFSQETGEYLGVETATLADHSGYSPRKQT